jgi:hypothetical protein
VACAQGQKPHFSLREKWAPGKDESSRPVDNDETTLPAAHPAARGKPSVPPLWVVLHPIVRGECAVRDQFLKLHDRIDTALTVLISTSDENLRRKTLLEMRAAIDEVDRLLDTKEQPLAND